MIDDPNMPPPVKEVAENLAISPKRKSPMKKLKTVTAIAMERYDPTENDDLSELKSNEGVKTKTTRRKQAKGKAAPKQTKKTLAPKLLSPASAALTCETQNVLFGTSSQLAGPEPPTYLRNLQQALVESVVTLPNNGLKAKRFRSAVSVARGSMWNAGALHSDDDVLQLSKVEEGWKDIDSESPGLSASIAAQSEQPTAFQAEKPSSKLENSGETGWRDIDDDAGVSGLPPIYEKPEKSVNQPIRTIPTVSSPTKRPRGRPRKGIATCAGQGCTNSQASRKAPLSKSKVSTKITSDGFIDIDEIQDSEPEPTPSPPRLVPSATSPLPLTSVSVAPVSKSQRAARYGSRPKWDTIKDSVFQKITDTVMSTPRSVDLRNSTWYEKMLMYEPIVLEDFTAWLNESGLVVGEKELLLPWMAQKWCEEQSVCCLWKLNNRNTARPA
jgi:Slx4 endonuclease